MGQKVKESRNEAVNNRKLWPDQWNLVHIKEQIYFSSFPTKFK